MNANIPQLIKAIGETGQPPCETCRHYRDCSQYQWACEDFGLYTHYGADIRNAVVLAKKSASKMMAKLEAMPEGKAKSDYESEVIKKYNEVRRIERFGVDERQPNRDTFVGVMAGFWKGGDRTAKEYEQDRSSVVMKLRNIYA